MYLCNRSATLLAQEAETGRSQKLAWATERIQGQYERGSETLTQNKHCNIHFSGRALAKVCETLYAAPNTAKRRETGRVKRGS